MKRNIRIGTSGWMYKHWNDTFYGENQGENQLVFYAREFDTVELNYSFYRMPGPQAYKDWYVKTPPHFIFTIKMNRFLTHLKRLIIDEETMDALHSFLQDTQGLKEKLGVILIQLQPKQFLDFERLSTFLKFYSQELAVLEFKPATCIEFRNATWLTPEIYDLLEHYNVAMVFPSTQEYRKLVFTSDFAFIRLHGNKSYSDDELEQLKKEIDDYPSKIKKVYIYFNNDFNTWAIYNARFLKLLIEY